MRVSFFNRLAATGLIALLIALPRGAAQAETMVGSNVDSRVILGVSANADGVQAMMPEGWTTIAFPAGPLKGANLLLAMIDSKIEMDPYGKPLVPASRRAAGVVGLAKQTDGEAVRMFVLRIYTTAPHRDPYGNALAADIDRTQSLSCPADGARHSADNWHVAPMGGGDLTLVLNHATGKRGWRQATLSGAGGRSDERRHLDLHGQGPCS
ncbi:MAG: hypothetical protein GY717_12670 [Rhodobacteraceae bacterium]|nr:hypothetical protein [Paracoccaceae bacterium]